MTESASSTSGQEFDVAQCYGLEGRAVGTLPGSDLKGKLSVLHTTVYVCISVCVY